MIIRKVKVGEAEIFLSPVGYWLIILLALVLATIITIALAFYTVKDGEVAVVTRLGKFKTIAESGPHWKIPWGIDRIKKIKVEYPYTINIGFSEIENDSGISVRHPILTESRFITGDGYYVDVFWLVNYRIVEPQSFVLNSLEPERKLKLLAQAAMRKAVGNFSLREVFQTGRDEMASMVLKFLNDDLLSLNLGVKIVNIELKEIKPVSIAELTESGVLKGELQNIPSDTTTKSKPEPSPDNLKSEEERR